MTRGLTVFMVLLSSGVCRGGLLTNFSASYALYQQCTASAADFDSDNDIDGIDFLMWQRGISKTGLFITPFGDADRSGHVNQLDMTLWESQYGVTNVGLSESVCFKLYLDPEGIIAGKVTVTIDVPNPFPGQVRLALDDETGVVDVHPLYTAQVLQTSLFPLPNRQRLVAEIEFAAINPTNPPVGPITLFGYQAHDNLPQLGPAGAQIGFEFRPGNFVTVFDTVSGQATTFDNTQLAGKTMPASLPLILDVNTVTGAISLRNPSTAPMEINYYEITSVAGGLNVGGWVSLDDIEGDPPGIGWEEAGGASAKALSETNLTTTLMLSNGQGRSLNHAYNELAGLRDLTFMYATPQGSLIPGRINYNATSLVDPVPEPGCLGLALVGMAGMASRRRRPR